MILNAERFCCLPLNYLSFRAWLDVHNPVIHITMQLQERHRLSATLMRVSRYVVSEV